MGAEFRRSMYIRIQTLGTDGDSFGCFGGETVGEGCLYRGSAKNAGTRARDGHANGTVGKDRNEHTNEREARSALMEFLVTGASRNGKRNAHDDLSRIERC